MNLEGCPYAVTPMALPDVPTVAAVEQQVFSLPWSASAFRYELAQNRSSEYLTLRYTPWEREPAQDSFRHLVQRLIGRGRRDPSLVGYGGFWFLIDEAHITTIGLRPEWRGRSLGELLLVSLIERALERGAATVSLEVRVSNAIAQSLYAKYGFKHVGTRKGYYSDNREDALIMTIEEAPSSTYQQHLEDLRARLCERLAVPSRPPASVDPSPRLPNRGRT